MKKIMKKKQNKKKKKMNNKGFTLIELLAVITIMGILMMVAIPQITRTIENSRRDSFATTAGEYLNAVRNNYMADNIECGSGSNYVVASGTADGTYYFPINSTKQNTIDLMESGGKSPFGNTEVKGYVIWTKTTTATADGGSKTKIVYKVRLADSGNHGLQAGTTCELEGKDLKRANVSTNLTDTCKLTDTDVSNDLTPSTGTGCRLS